MGGQETLSSVLTRLADAVRKTYNKQGGLTLSEIVEILTPKDMMLLDRGKLIFDQGGSIIPKGRIQGGWYRTDRSSLYEDAVDKAITINKLRVVTFEFHLYVDRDIDLDIGLDGKDTPLINLKGNQDNVIKINVPTGTLKGASDIVFAIGNFDSSWSAFNVLIDKSYIKLLL